MVLLLCLELVFVVPDVIASPQFLVGQDVVKSTVSCGSKNRRPKVALVVGITGIVGTSLANLLLRPDAPGGPWKNLQHIVLQTGGKHYVGTSRYTWSSHGKEPPFMEDMPRLPFPNFYYTLEDILFDTLKRKDVNLTWFVHRQKVIFGFSPCSLMNILGTFDVYTCICKHEGLPSLFPSNSTYWEQFGNVSDADLAAEQELWAEMDSIAKN
ncbi:hypothetical protein L7F22_009876 [Adiantum nelumboides]|nr:hypothetical protein [Adiantum nelumboides]